MPQSNLTNQVYSDKQHEEGQSKSSAVIGFDQITSACVERRTHRLSRNQTTLFSGNHAAHTCEHLPSLKPPGVVSHHFGNPLQSITRVKVLELTSRQLEISQSLNHPLSLLLLELVSDQEQSVSEIESVTKEVAKVFLSQLRATDLVLRYGGHTIVAILPEAGESGVRVVVARLKEAIKRQVLGPRSLLRTIFGVSGKLAGFSVASDDLLMAAEEALERSRVYELKCTSPI